MSGRASDNNSKLLRLMNIFVQNSISCNVVLRLFLPIKFFCKAFPMSNSQDERAEYRQLRDTIYTFFYYSNKPVIANEVVLQFKSCKKATVQKILEDLVSKEKIFMRTIGKSKVYCLSQDMTFEIDESVYTDEIDRQQDQSIDDKVLRYLKWSHERHIAELNKLKEESKKLDQILNGYENQLSVDELKREIKDMKTIVMEHKEKGKSECVSYEEFNKKKKEYSNIKKELTKRNQIYKNIVDGICEGCGIKKKDLLRSVGLEE